MKFNYNEAVMFGNLVKEFVSQGNPPVKAWKLAYKRMMVVKNNESFVMCEEKRAE